MEADQVIALLEEGNVLGLMKNECEIVKLGDYPSCLGRIPRGLYRHLVKVEELVVSTLTLPGCVSGEYAYLPKYEQKYAPYRMST